MSAVWCAAARTLVDDRKKEPEVNKLGESHTLLSQARIFCRWIRTLALTFFEDSLPEHKKKKKNAGGRATLSAQDRGSPPSG